MGAIEYALLAAGVAGMIWAIHLLRCDAYDQGYKAGWKMLAAVIDKQLEEGTK